MWLTPKVLAALPAPLDAMARWRLVFAGYAGCWFVAAAAWLFVNAGKPIFPPAVHAVHGPGPDAPLS